MSGSYLTTAGSSRPANEKLPWDSEYRGAVKVWVAVRVAETGAVTGAVAGIVRPGLAGLGRGGVRDGSVAREWRGWNQAGPVPV